MNESDHSVTNVNLKPCVYCAKDCATRAINIGSFYTTYLRICNHECLLSLTYEYLQSINAHISFMNHLDTLENEEDKQKRLINEHEVFNECTTMLKKILKETFNDSNFLKEDDK